MKPSSGAASVPKRVHHLNLMDLLDSRPPQAESANFKSEIEEHYLDDLHRSFENGSASALDREKVIRAQLRLLADQAGSTEEEHGETKETKAGTNGDEEERELIVQSGLLGGMVVTLDPTSVLHCIVAREARIKYFTGLVKYLAVYALFIISLMYRPLRSNDSFQAQNGLQNLISRAVSPSTGESYEGIHDAGSLFDYWEHALLPTLFAPEQQYNGAPISAEDAQYFGQFYRLVAGMALVQRRVNSTAACDSSPRFCESFAPTKWINIDNSESNLQREPFGPPWDPMRYQFDDGGGNSRAGHTVLLPMDKSLAIKRLHELRDEMFLDKSTRQVLTDIVVYSVNFRIFGTLSLVSDFDVNGEVKTTLRTEPLNLEEPPSLLFIHYLCLAIPLVWNIQVVAREFGLFVCCRRGPRVGCALKTGLCFTTTWHFILTLGMATHPLLSSEFALPWNQDASNDDKNREFVISFGQLLDLVAMDNWAVFIAQFLNIFTLFSYLMPFPEIGIFMLTLSRATGQLLSYTGMMLVVMMLYAYIGYYTFGHALEEWHTYDRSFFSVLLMTIADYDVNVLRDAVRDDYMATLYYDIVLGSMEFIIFNMFIAIIFASFDTTMDDLSQVTKVDFLGETTRRALILRKTHVIEQRMPFLAVVSRRWLSPSRSRRCCSTFFSRAFLSEINDYHLPWPVPVASVDACGGGEKHAAGDGHNRSRGEAVPILDDTGLMKMLEADEYLSTGRLAESLQNRIHAIKGRTDAGSATATAAQAVAGDGGEDMDTLFHLDTAELAQVLRAALVETNGTIIDLIQQVQAGNETALRDVFVKIDDDKSGWISPLELYRYLHRLEVKEGIPKERRVQMKQIVALQREADSDGNLQLEYEEFEEMIMKPNAGGGERLQRIADEWAVQIMITHGTVARSMTAEQADPGLATTPIVPNPFVQRQRSLREVMGTEQQVDPRATGGMMHGGPGRRKSSVSMRGRRSNAHGGRRSIAEATRRRKSQIEDALYHHHDSG